MNWVTSVGDLVGGHWKVGVALVIFLALLKLVSSAARSSFSNFQQVTTGFLRCWLWSKWLKRCGLPIEEVNQLRMLAAKQDIGLSEKSADD